MLLDTPHAMQTITRVIMDDHGRTLFGMRTMICFFSMNLLCGFLIFTGQKFYILVILIFYGPYHIMMQHFGMASLYRAKAAAAAGVMISGAQDKMLLIATYCLSLSWACNDLFNLGPLWLWAEFIEPFKLLGLGFIPPLITQFWGVIILPIAFVFFVLSLMAWLFGVLQDVNRGLAINKPRLLVVGLAVLNFMIVFFVLNGVAHSMSEGLFLVVVGITAWHTLQYNGLVWHYNNKKFSTFNGGGSRALAWLSSRRRYLYYMTFIVVLSLGAQSTILGLLWLDMHIVKSWAGSAHGLVLMAYSVTFTHYYLDALIWKGKHNNELGRVLL